MRYAVIDIGSNTVRMNIYDVTQDGGISAPLLTQSESLGLLNYITENELGSDGIERLNNTLRAFREYAENFSCDKIIAFGTAALRNIFNSNYVARKIEENTGLKIDVISGENEALLSFAGVKLSLGEIKTGIMADMGGGSTEVIGFVDGMAVRCSTMPFGSLSLYRSYVSRLFPTKPERTAIKKEVYRRIGDLVWMTNYAPMLYIVGGTARTAMLLKNELIGEGEVPNAMSFNELDELYEIIKSPSKDTIETFLRVAPDRLHTIIPGVITIRRIAKFAGAKNIVVSTTGIREGYLFNAISG